MLGGLKYKDLSNFFISCVMCLILSGCQTGKEEIIVDNPDNLYSESVALLHQGKFAKAALNFEAIEKEIPGSKVALESGMLKGYAYYMDDKFDDSIFASEDFIKQYPRDKHVDYVYYLKAMCYYRQMVDVGRDQKLTLDALKAMREVVGRFPETKYAKDAMWKIDYVYSMLAGKEMAIGRSYLTKNIPSAAVNRFRTVIMEYDDTLFVSEALYRMVEIYKAWGIEDQALYYASILGHNYPETVWYRRAYDMVKTS